GRDFSKDHPRPAAPRQFWRARARVGGSSWQNRATAKTMVGRAHVREQFEGVSYSSAQHSGRHDRGKMAAALVRNPAARLFVAPLRSRAMGRYVFSSGPVRNLFVRSQGGTSGTTHALL